MCGLAGYANFKTGVAPDHDLIAHMADALVHRGPDSSGCFHDACVGFGFRRLRIIDLVSGDQPLYNEDRSLVLMCNGEIFNYKELRQGLVERGHSFATRCDVEVLLHLYEEKGPDLLQELNGQFAFALYDRKERRLLLARDHVGINPLFYTVAGDTFIFGSEIKAILRHPLVRREVDPTGLDQILCFPGLVSPRTMFKGIRSLESGHLLIVSPEGIRNEEYWDLVYPRADEPGGEMSEAEAVESLGESFARSVRYRLQSDVPVGLYLSGGLDSSLIAGMIAREAPGTVNHSFSIGFTDERISETAYQRLMAERVGSHHEEIVFDWSQIESRMRRMVYHCECPVKESYNTCSLALSEAARRAGITVILTGEGADELFAGYVGYRFDQSGLRRERGDGLAAALEDEMRERLWGDRDLFYEQDYYASRELRAALYAEGLGTAFPEFDCLNESPVNKERLAGRHPVHQRSYLDFKLRMADHLISDHGDRMALANSIEARYPFLDLGVVDLARRMPPGLKLRNLGEKYVLKRVAEGLVPRSIIEREKFGFHAPGSPYLLHQGIDWIHDLLSPDRIRRQGYFNPDMVETLKRQYLREGFRLNLPFENDLLMIVLTFGVFLEAFDLPCLR
ncbi:MAG TPA: asparagine synthase (glutamine-hydrolyzing) [Acidobacteria bacterium]|nr:asparagine synthase (glutamine-hydrolyzing) [Acidobacteriota bacterium]